MEARRRLAGETFDDQVGTQPFEDADEKVDIAVIEVGLGGRFDEKAEILRVPCVLLGHRRLFE